MEDISSAFRLNGIHVRLSSESFVPYQPQPFMEITRVTLKLRAERRGEDKLCGMDPFSCKSCHPLLPNLLFENHHQDSFQFKENLALQSLLEALLSNIVAKI